MVYRIILCIFLVLQVDIGDTIDWNDIVCSTDVDQHMPEGILPDDQVGRFPWMGVIQHGFYLGGKTRYAITMAVLIHPAFAIAPAEDMEKIDRKSIYNHTHLILWQSEQVKHSINVLDYSLHPDILEEITYATIALVEVLPRGVTYQGHAAPVLPITLPTSGVGTFSELYVVKITDQTAELKKEVWSVDYVENTDCNGFYARSGLAYGKMTPTSQHCVVAKSTKEPCVWDGGAALITRQSWGHWKLLGFGVRGPGCGAPARFVNVHAQMPWLDERISHIPNEALPEDMEPLLLRSLSPVEVIVYKATDTSPEKEGQCGRKARGNVLYKEESEVLINKNFAQGFYFLAVASVMDVTCAQLKLVARARTSTSVWIEHHCHRDLTGVSRPYELRKLECFVYYKTTAYVEFRYQFSFRGVLELTLYGKTEIPAASRLRPEASFQTTLSWWPTDQAIFRWGRFVPVASWWYAM